MNKFLCLSIFWREMLFIGCLFLGLGSSNLCAQTEIAGYTQPVLARTLKLDPPNQVQSYPFWVDQTTSFSLTLSSLIKTLDLRLVDPQGHEFIFGQPASGQFTSDIVYNIALKITPNPAVWVSSKSHTLRI